MVKSLKSTLASEYFVYGVVSRSEKRLEEKLDEMEKKAEKRYNKVMTHLVSIAGQFKKFDEERVILADTQRKHTDKIEKLEHLVFQPS